MSGFPTTLSELQDELLIHAKDGRGGKGDAGFRLAIAIDNLGSFTRHYTHDQNENPTARPHGTQGSKISDAGHAIVQILTYIAVCDVDLQDAVNIALVGLRERDFQKRCAENENLIKGVVAFGEDITLMVWVPTESEPLPICPEEFAVVLSHAISDSQLTKFGGIITDHGGMACHAAIIARERSIPCIVGTGNATQLLKAFDIIHMHTDGTIVKVEGGAEVIRRNTT